MLNFDLVVQRQVIRAGLDDFSPNATLTHLHGGQYGPTPETWREAVIDFVRAMLSAGLITPLRGREDYKLKNPEEICEILRHGDIKNGLDAETMWCAMYFEGTDELVMLLRNLNLLSWDATNGTLSLPLGELLAKMNVVRVSHD